MELSTIIGLVAATCTTAGFLPQAVKTVKTKQTRDLSRVMYSLTTFGIGMWLIYGIILGSAPLIIANLISLALTSAILYLKIKYH